MTDIAARLDEIEAVCAWTPYPEVLKMQLEKLADAAPGLVAALRAVLDLHAPVTPSWCDGCDAQWPCNTIARAAAALEES